MKKSNLLTQVVAELEAREAKGIETYGTTLDRTDLTRSQWLRHAYEEALDLALYLKKLKIEEDDKRIGDWYIAQLFERQKKTSDFWRKNNFNLWKWSYDRMDV